MSTAPDRYRSSRLFRALLRLFPADFRDRYGGQMEQLFGDEVRDAGSDGRDWSLFRLWSRTLLGLLRSAPGEHLAIVRMDTRYALRLLRRSPGTSLVAVLILALGIGANTALYSVVEAAYFDRLPFADDELLVRIFLTRSADDSLISLVPDLFLEIRRSARSFEGVVAQRYTNLSRFGEEGAERLAGLGVSAGWQDVLGLDPHLGRGFTGDEEELGRASGVVIISHELWSTRVGGREELIGRRIDLDGSSAVVVGVMPPGFRFPYENDVWHPMNLEREAEGFWGLNVQARLRRGVGLEEARVELAHLTRSLEGEYPELLQDMTLVPVPTRTDLLGDDGPLLLALFGAVGFVLLLVCVNLASLLLARSVARQRELAIRAALGAARSRRIRQLLTESLLLALFGGGLGLPLALASRGPLYSLLPERMRNLVEELPFDGSLFAFALGATLLVGLLFGIAPALLLSAQSSLRARDGRSGRGHRLLAGLVVVEVALAVILLVAAGAMARNFRVLAAGDPGYAARELLALSVELAGPGSTPAGPQQRLQLLEAIADRLETLPGVRRVGATCILPSRRANLLTRLAVEGRPAEPGEELLVNHRLVSAGFLEAMGIPLLRGRTLRTKDRLETEPVVVVSERLARHFWPGEDPLEKRVRRISRSEPSGLLTVVGVVAEVRESDRVAGTWYLPYAQHPDSIDTEVATFVIRTELPPAHLAEAAGRAVRDVDPSLPLFDVAPVRELYGRELSEERVGTLVMAGFGGFGLLLAALGIGAVMAYAVSRKTQEIGVRRALGARSGQILRSILGQGASLALSGVLLGLLGAWGVTRLLDSLLSEVEPGDPRALIAAASLTVVVAIAATLLPALRAARVPPVIALRSE